MQTKSLVSPVLLVGIALAYLFIVFATVQAQETTPDPTSTPTPSPTPLAHLTFRTCLIPNTNTFRLSFRADYMPGEYRIVAQNSGGTLNLGYLEVGQEGGGFGEDNTTYVLHEDTWIKQWFNGERWQRAGGLPVTNAQQHLDAGLICETGARTTYAPTTSYTTPTPSSNTSNTNTGVGGVTTISNPTPSPSPVIVAQIPNTSSTTKQVLGASSLGDTGVFEDTLQLILFSIGALTIFGGIKLFKQI